MTSERFVSYLPYECPEKLKKAIQDCSSPSDVLDTLLKFLGDSSNDAMMNSIVELFLNTMSEFTIQPSETEFTVLSLQNIFNGYKSKANIQSKILIIVTSLLLTQDHDSELTSDVVEFLIKLLENPTESIVVQKLSLDSLIEIEVVYPEILAGKACLLKNLLHNKALGDKAAELLSLMVKNSTETEHQDFRPQVNLYIKESEKKKNFYF